MIWLIGCKGMLGTELSLQLEKSGIPFIGTDIETDITNLKDLTNFIKDKQISLVINCAAYTAVDKAEDDADACYRLNTLGPENIAICSKNSGARMIHISTDYVFDGKNKIPYREEDQTNPTGVYGRTKRDGETAVLANNPQSHIIRTAWLYGKYSKNFVSTMVQLMNQKEKVTVVNDQYGSPTWAFDLASAILHFTEKNEPYGIYHYTNQGGINWYDFAKEIYRQGKELHLIKNNCSVLPCTSAEYPSRVQRPSYSVLDTGKISRLSGITISPWDASLREYLIRCAH